jgi:toxin ParE1/3/4
VADYALSRRVGRDLADILRFTIERFGADKARAYRDGLVAAFEAIARHPVIGTDQRHIKPGLRRLVHASHSIYYRRSREGTRIVRLLGPGQDPSREL